MKTMNHRDNLPDNVTDKMIDDHFGADPCPECNGDGEINCGCPRCNGVDCIDCPVCDGTGVAQPENL